jgi:hypothetical protein
MTSPPSIETHAVVPPFVCECDEWVRSACKGLGRYGEHAGRQYCVLHYPDEKDDGKFRAALNKKLDERDFDFSGVWFHERAAFNRPYAGDVNFNYATFFEEADFIHAMFEGSVSFRGAVFRAPAHFKNAGFLKSAYFGSATFHATADFNSAVFYGGTYFSFATFHSHVRFAGYALTGDSGTKVFEGQDASLNLWAATVENRDHLSFRNVRLRPHWFVNVDARRFEFVQAHWDWRRINLREEINCTGRTDVRAAHHLLSTACRNLAINAEENHRYGEASEFRYLAMNARRLERSRGRALWTLDWWYWFASGYGERILRALAILFAVWLGFTLLYWSSGLRCDDRAGDDVNCIGWAEAKDSGGVKDATSQQSMVSATGEAQAAARKKSRFDNFAFSGVYTLEVMTLQKPDPRPLTSLAHFIVLLCTIFGPVQAALLALAVRRRFMR